MEAFCIDIPSGLNNVLGIIQEGQSIRVENKGMPKNIKNGFQCSYLKCKVAWSCAGMSPL